MEGMEAREAGGGGPVARGAAPATAVVLFIRKWVSFPVGFQAERGRTNARGHDPYEPKRTDPVS